MDTSNVAVATITRVTSAAEEALIARALEGLSQSGLPVAVADASPRAGFTEHLSRLPGFSLGAPRGAGLIAQVQASLELAATFGTAFILYVEPDKELFFGRLMTEFVRRAPAERDVGVVLPARSAASFETYPPMQRYTEGVINYLCGELIGSTGDYSYGPFLMNRVLLQQLTALQSEMGWGWRHFAFRTAHQQGFRVLQLTDDYPCPADRRAEDDAERTHRLRQLSQNIAGLIA